MDDDDKRMTDHAAEARKHYMELVAYRRELEIARERLVQALRASQYLGWDKQ